MKALSAIIGLLAITALRQMASGQPDIVSYEYFFDTDPGQGNGTVVNLAVEEQGPSTSFNFEIPAITMGALSEGNHKLVVRTKDANGDWSVAFFRNIRIGMDTAPPPVPDIVAAEYFFDTDPGQGNGTPIEIDTPGPKLETSFNISAEIIAALSVGNHKLVVRTQDAEGDWSVGMVRNIRRVDPTGQGGDDPKVARIDYQWLIEGEEVGETVSLTPETPAKVISFEEMADLSDLPGGGVTAVLRMTPFDTLGNQGWPAFKTVVIEWLDDDGDGLPNQWEELYAGFDPQVANDGSIDTDQDGLTDKEEFENGTDPTNKDTDGDNVFDGAEITLAEYGFDPKEDNSDILAKFESAASGTGIFADLVQDTINSVIADPSVYDLFTETQVETAAQAARTFVNVSARVGVGGEDVVIPGFTIIGSTKKILIRAVGPKLADFGVESPLPDPSFEIFQARFDGMPADLLASVDNWTEDGGDLEAIKAAIASTGAFPLEAVEDFQGAPRPTDDTKSPATVLELGLGVYTVVVRSVDGSFGEVLVEAYEVDEE